MQCKTDPIVCIKVILVYLCEFIGTIIVYVGRVAQSI